MPKVFDYPFGIVRDWHDGDTAHIDLELGFGFILAAYDLDGKPVLSCRIFGINAPELNVAHPELTPEGAAAHDYANAICPPGTRVKATSHSWDKYGGRWDGTLTLPDGRDFATAMLTAGHAVLMGAM